MVRSGSSNTSLTHAKVVGTTCNVCDPEDVHNLAKFALNELGSIDIWVSHELTDWIFRYYVALNELGFWLRHARNHANFLEISYNDV